MRQIIRGAAIIIFVAVGACKGAGGGAAAIAKIEEMYARRGQISDGWLAVMEQNAADQVVGLQKGAEYVSTNAPLLAQMAIDLCDVVRANQHNTMVRGAFQKVNADVKTGMEAWKQRAGAVGDRYPGHGEDLSAQYASLTSAFFETAKECMPE